MKKRASQQNTVLTCRLVVWMMTLRLRNYEAIHSIDEKLIADTKKNSCDGFVRKLYLKMWHELSIQPSIKRSKDKDTGEETDKYPPTFKAKIPFWDDKFTCTVWDHNRTKLEGDFGCV